MPNKPVPDNDRSLAARAAALSSWADTDDWSQRTRAARERFLQRFEDQVDPKRALPADQRAKRAERARRAYFTELARRSARSRRRRDEADQLAELRDDLTRALDDLTVDFGDDGGEAA